MPIDPATKRSDLDVFATTEPASFREVAFACGPISWSFDQQHAVHTYPDRDAGYIEATGRNPAVFKFTAIFRRGLVGEGGGRAAFPDQFFKFSAACADRTTGELVHPILGKIKVKCRSFNATADISRRDGVDVEVEFIESTEKEDELQALLQQVSPLGSAYDAARSFDDNYASLQPEPPELPETLSPSLLDSLKQLNGLAAQVQMGIGNVTSQIQGYASAVNDLTDRLISLDNPNNYRAIDALERLFAAVNRLGEEVVKRSRPIRIAILLREMSLTEAASTYATPIADFCRLNPLVASREVLRPGTGVFVFA